MLHCTTTGLHHRLPCLHYASLPSAKLHRQKQGRKLCSRCWGIRKSDGVPEHKIYEQERTSHEERGDKESPKACAHLKSCESLYMDLAPPFIGRRRDFYILRIPSNLENIPSVNMYINIFYIP
jgi:hypothetical protein